MITLFHKSEHDHNFQTLENLEPGCWVNVENATRQDIEELATILELPLTDLIDSLDPFEMPRIEMENDTIILFVRNPTISGQNLHTETLTIILTPQYIITISPFVNPIISNLFEQNPAITTTLKSKFMLYLLMRITQSFTTQIKHLQLNVFKTKSRVEEVDSKDILSLTKSEEILNHYRSTLVPLKNTLFVLSTGRFVRLYENDKDYLEDLLNSTKQSEDICDVNLKSIRSLRDCYQTIFTNRLNRTIKLLTAITIIFTIPTIIASLYGMNVKLPFQEDEHAFGFIMMGTLAICLISTVIFHWKRWL
ncbi:MAG: Cobalt/magnesium transport protein CorA [Chlamydiae bacterium]|nr:Cobalt/magnesium transport protein CorA [Chlamydiota bacterium]